MDRGKYMTTGEVANVMHVTKNTLFHYDKIGLFSPEIKLENDYRFYGVQQMELLDAILWLRELDMPLEEIREFLRDRTPEKLMELFAVEEKLVEQQLKRLKDRRSWMREKKAAIENIRGLDLASVYRKNFQQRYYLMDEVAGDSEKDFAKSITNLMEAYSENNESICYKIGYLQSEQDIRGGIYDQCRKVVLMLASKPKGIRYHILEGGEYLAAYHVGHWEQIGGAYKRILAYAGSEGLTLSDCFVEISVIDNLAAEQEEDFVTEISVKIK